MHVREPLLKQLYIIRFLCFFLKHAAIFNESENSEER